MSEWPTDQDHERLLNVNSLHIFLEVFQVHQPNFYTKKLFLEWKPNRQTSKTFLQTNLKDHLTGMTKRGDCQNMSQTCSIQLWFFQQFCCTEISCWFYNVAFHPSATSLILYSTKMLINKNDCCYSGTTVKYSKYSVLK